MQKRPHQQNGGGASRPPLFAGLFLHIIFNYCGLFSEIFWKNCEFFQKIGRNLASFMLDRPTQEIFCYFVPILGAPCLRNFRKYFEKIGFPAVSRHSGTIFAYCSHKNIKNNAQNRKTHGSYKIAGIFGNWLKIAGKFRNLLKIAWNWLDFQFFSQFCQKKSENYPK